MVTMAMPHRCCCSIPAAVQARSGARPEKNSRHTGFLRLWRHRRLGLGRDAAARRSSRPRCRGTVSHAGLADSTVGVVGHSYVCAGLVSIVLRELANVHSSLVLIEPMLAPLLVETGENKLFGEYEFLAHVFCRGLPRGRATHRHTGRRQLCTLRHQNVTGRLQIIVTGLAVVRLSLCPRLVSPGSYEAARQIGPLPRPQDALYEPERRWARYADHRILHLIVAERIFTEGYQATDATVFVCVRGQGENPNWTQAS